MHGRTFSVDLLAHAAYSLVLDCSVATIDVEERILYHEESTTEQKSAGQQGASAGGRTTSREASPGLADRHSHPRHVLVHRILRHFVELASESTGVGG